MSKRAPAPRELAYISTYTNRFGVEGVQVVLSLWDAGRILDGESQALAELHRIMDRDLRAAVRAYRAEVKERALVDRIERGAPCAHDAGEYQGRCKGCGADLMEVAS